MRFFSNDDFQYGLELALGAAYHRAADVGEVLATAERIKDEDSDAWVHEWLCTAGGCWAAAREADAAGHRVSAVAHYRRAATYYATALERFTYAAGEVPGPGSCGSGGASASAGTGPSTCRPGRASGCRSAGRPSWRRRIKISAVFQASSRRDIRSQETARMVRRKTNRKHMTSDHHGRVAERATLLVRAVDGIRGTHSSFELCVVRDRQL